MALSATLLAPTLALSPMAEAKPRGCFTKTEIAAEQNIRLGLRLREGARQCQENPWNANTVPLWTQLDQTLGSRFAQQTEIRRRAFEREFDKNAEDRLVLWNGRIVMYYRNYPASQLYCANIRQMLDKFNKKGWAQFAKQAAKARDEVKLDYKTCP